MRFRRKSAKRDKTEGFVERTAGRAMELFSKLTGKRSTAAKGKAARARGRGKSARGGAKKRVGHR
jgi:uncharacterized protein YjbJ (UPF0337 family)